MPHDQITGPLSRTEFAALVTAPHGEARKAIRKHDPFYRLEPGEKVRFRVEVSGRMRGMGYVEATSQAEAEKLAEALTDASFDWMGGDFDIVEVRPDER